MRDPNTAPDEGQEPPEASPPAAGQRRKTEALPTMKKARARKPISRILSRMNRGSCLGDHFSGIRVTPNLKRPTRRPRPGQSLRRALASTARVFLFGLAPGDAYRASDVTIPAVGSYPAVSPLPEPLRVTEVPHTGHRRFVFCGAGVGSLRLDVIQRPCPWSPDFPPVEQARRASTRAPPTRNESIRAAR